MAPDPTKIPGLSEWPDLRFGTDVSPYLAQIFDGTSQFFDSANFGQALSAIKIVSLILSVILGAIIVAIAFKMRGLFKEEITEAVKVISQPPAVTSASQARWQEIRGHANSFEESEWKMAVIEADKLVDETLKIAGFGGETMGERLMLIRPDQIANLQFLWDAHKLRNLIVHDVNYKVTRRQAIWAVEAFENVLKELGAL